MPAYCLSPLQVVSRTVFNHFTQLNEVNAYSISDFPQGGGGILIERGIIREGFAYSQNHVMRIIYLVAFQFFYPIFYGFDIQFNE